MKFGQDFQAALAREEYPQEWINSAISYKKLKKCIKRVQQELQSLGLDQETLNALWQHAGNTSDASADDNGSGRLLQYTLDGNKKVNFTPRLTIAIDPRDGSPMDAWLSPETRRVLRRLAQTSRSNSMVSNGVNSGNDAIHTNGQPIPLVRQDSAYSIVTSPEVDEHLETIEIPLTSDSEFFQILRRELVDLENLQKNEQKQLQAEIIQLGKNLRALKAATGKKSEEEIAIWRRIFQLYTEAQIFLSSNEQDAGTRNATQAQQHLQTFNKTLVAQQSQVLRFGKEANAALDWFLRINVNLLRMIKFQEINRIALQKIMKKFDKRTALHARSFISTSLLDGPLMSKDLAKATYYVISNELLHIIPQLDDYLCPVCFSISWKPVRLRCNHIFCIRCLIVMQKAEQDHCPLCRGAVVMEASSENLDKQLMTFLKTNFKQEVKEKQKSNEHAAGVDRWGEQYEKSQKCIVM